MLKKKAEHGNGYLKSQHQSAETRRILEVSWSASQAEVVRSRFSDGPWLKKVRRRSTEEDTLGVYIIHIYHTPHSEIMRWHTLQSQHLGDGDGSIRSSGLA